MKRHLITYLVLAMLLLSACSAPIATSAGVLLASTATTGSVPAQVKPAPTKAAAAPASPATASADLKPISAKTIPCPMPLPSDEVDGETIICGEIVVPENWEKPTGQTVTITYARQVSRNQSPLPDPVLYFMGGPGGSVLAAQGVSSFDFNYLRELRDVIVWDQRGNRYSTDLFCPANVSTPDLAATDAAMEALGPFNFTLDDDPAEILAYTFKEDEIQGMERCAEYFASEGRDLTQYNTPNTVRDSIALMNHLGYPSYNLFGISYGTQVILAIADYYGKNPDQKLPAIRSSLIDSVFPQNLNPGEDVLIVPNNVLRVFSACEEDAACAKAYPNIRQRLIDLLAILKTKPITDPDGAKITLAEVRDMLHTAIENQNAQAISYLPRLVAELERGETATYHVVGAILDGKIQPPAAALETTPSLLDPISFETSRAAQDLRAIAERLDALSSSTGELDAAMDEAQTMPELFVSLVNRYLQSTDPGSRFGYSSRVSDTYVSHPEKQTRAGLLAYVQANFPETLAGELTAIANLLSDADVAEVWKRVANERALQALYFLDVTTNITVKCNDRGSTYKIGPVMDYIKKFESQELISDIKMPAAYEAHCNALGLAPADFAIPPAVVSDWPIFVMAGGLDGNTPAEWGQVAADTLPNSKLLFVPMTGHGVTRYSKCVKDIANVFFLYPDAELNTSCVDAFKPVFVLPGDELPVVPAN